MNIVENLNTEAQVQLLQTVAHHSHDHSFYVLMDCAFDVEVQDQLTAYPSISLYADTELAGFDIYSPRLYFLAGINAVNAVQYIQSFCHGKPMLSYIHSHCHLLQLKQHFTSILEAHCEDNTSWVLRFADTRISLSLLDVLHEEQQQPLLAPLHAWYIPNRFGGLDTVYGEDDAFLPSKTSVLRLDDEQLSQLVDNAAVDAMLNLAQARHPDQFDNYTPTEKYNKVELGLKQAQQLDVQDQPSILNIVMQNFT